jgi:hypothetical protein
MSIPPCGGRTDGDRAAGNEGNMREDLRRNILRREAAPAGHLNLTVPGMAPREWCAQWSPALVFSGSWEDVYNKGYPRSQENTQYTAYLMTFASISSGNCEEARRHKKTGIGVMPAHCK